MRIINVCKFIFKDAFMMHLMNYDSFRSKDFYNKKLKMYDYKRKKSIYRFSKKIKLNKNMIIRFYIDNKIDISKFKNCKDSIISYVEDDIIFSFSMMKINDILYEKGYEGLIKYLQYISNDELNEINMFELSYMIVIDSSEKIIHIV